MNISLADLKKAVDSLFEAAEKYEQDPKDCAVKVIPEGPLRFIQIEARIGSLRVIEAVRPE